MSDDVNEPFELTTVPRDRSDMIIWPIQLKNYPLLLWTIINYLIKNWRYDDLKELVCDFGKSQ